MSRMSITSGKKALVLAISSVLAGWTASDGSYANGPSHPDPLDNWPPKKTVKIDSSNSPLEAIKGIEIRGDKNISLQDGILTIPSAEKVIKVVKDATVPGIVGKAGTNTLNLTNTGTAVEVDANATGVKVENGSLTISGKGSITPASEANTTTGVSIAAGGKLINSSIIKGATGVSMAWGELTNSGTIEGSTNAIAITGGATVNFQSGSVVTGLSSAPALNASSISPNNPQNVNNAVIVNIQGGTFTGEIKGGGNTNDTINITSTSKAEIKNNISGFETINIKGTDWTVKDWASGVKSLNTSAVIPSLYVNNAALSDLPKAEGSALNVNSKTLAVTTSTKKGVIENLNISSNPQLTGSGPITVNNITVNSSGWSLAPQLKGVKIVNAKNPTPAPAITEPVINAITLTGANSSPGVSVSSSEPGMLLNIITPSPEPEGEGVAIKITATEPGLITAVNVGSNAFVDSITNAETININGSGWDFEKPVINPETISVEAGGTVDAINSTFSGTTVGHPKETLNVAFNQQADVNGYLNIGGTGTISKIDFSNAANRPSLMYKPSGAISVENIKGNPSKADTLVLTDNSYLPEGKLPPGFKGIEYAAPPTTSITPNLKRLGLGGIVKDTTIRTILKADAFVSPSDVNSDENKGSTKSIPFTASGMPSAFYLEDRRRNRIILN